MPPYNTSTPGFSDLPTALKINDNLLIKRKSSDWFWFQNAILHLLFNAPKNKAKVRFPKGTWEIPFTHEYKVGLI